MDTATSTQAVPLLVGILILVAACAAVALALVRRTAASDREVRPARSPISDESCRLPDPASCRAILDGLPDPVVIRDLRGRIVGANRAYAALLAGPRQAGTHTPVRVLEEEIEAPDGARRISWCETTIEIEGCRHRLLSGREVSEEVRAQRRLEQSRAKAEAENEAKSRLLATVSHEFRTPLNGILGMTRLLLETELDAEQRTYAHAVASSAEAFLTLVEDILDFSQIEAGRIDLVDEPFELGALVQGIVELLAPRAQGKGTDIACLVARDVPRFVRGDADRLRQVLFNLAGNAVKFTRSGGVGISVERGPGDVVRILVEDTGPGIPADRASEVFEEFETGDRRSGEAGAGLGLAITRGLLDRMGGRIELESVVGQGSRFTVELPLPMEAGAEQEAEATQASRIEAPLSGPILILSGSPFEGGYLARTLQEIGLETVVVGTLDRALSRMQQQSFAVLIADHALPDTDVRVAAREAHRHGIGRSIVLLSPFERRDFGSPHAAGFDAYLVKPVRARSLLEQVAPRPPAALRPAPTMAAAQAIRPAGRPARRVLLAEDNEVNALLAVKALERLGAVVAWAHNGEEAWALADASLAGAALPFDLILTDVRMPGLDGIEVTRRIRERERELQRRPGRIVALTASFVGDVESPLRQAGFDGLLVKPFTFEALGAELAACDDAVPLAQAS